MFSKFMNGVLNIDISEIYALAFEKFKALPMRERDIECITQCIVFSWQQQAKDFNETINYIPRIKKIFDSKFTKANNKKFYKGIHLAPGKTMDDYDINKYEYVASTTHYRTAELFAIGNSTIEEKVGYWKKEGYECFILELEAEEMFDVQAYRDMDEDEYILKNSRIINIIKL